MKTLFIAILVSGFGQIAHAITDYSCVNRCTSQGKMYGLCVKECLTNDSQNYQQKGFKQTDYSCVSQCTSGGTLYQVCVDKCSY